MSAKLTEVATKRFIDNISSITPGARSDDEKARVEAHYTTGVKLLATVPLDGGSYTTRYTRDGKALIVAGEDGKVRFIEPAAAKVVKEFIPLPLSPKPTTASR
jgi:hypothetical protein